MGHSHGSAKLAVRLTEVGMHVVWCVVCVREGTHQFVFLELLLVQDVPGFEPEVNESEQRHNLGTLLRITHTQEWSNSPTVPQSLCSWPYSNTDGYSSLLPLTITLLPSPFTLHNHTPHPR